MQALSMLSRNASCDSLRSSELSELLDDVFDTHYGRGSRRAECSDVGLEAAEDKEDEAEGVRRKRGGKKV